MVCILAHRDNPQKPDKTHNTMTALHTDAEHVAAKMYADFRTYVSTLESNHVISAGQRAELCKGFLKTISDTFNVNPLEIAKGTSDQLAVQKIIRLVENPVHIEYEVDGQTYHEDVQREDLEAAADLFDELCGGCGADLDDPEEMVIGLCEDCESKRKTQGINSHYLKS